MGLKAAILEIFNINAFSFLFNSGIKSRVNKVSALILTKIIVSIKEIGVISKVELPPKPALLTKPIISNSCEKTQVANSLIFLLSLKSVSKKSIFTPYLLDRPSQRLPKSSSGNDRRTKLMTLLANFSAIARPRPMLPPVITTYLPKYLSSISTCYSYSFQQRKINFKDYI